MAISKTKSIPPIESFRNMQDGKPSLMAECRDRLHIPFPSQRTQQGARLMAVWPGANVSAKTPTAAPEGGGVSTIIKDGVLNEEAYTHRFRRQAVCTHSSGTT
jgi:hypothetical protein